MNKLLKILFAPLILSAMFWVSCSGTLPQENSAHSIDGLYRVIGVDAGSSLEFGYPLLYFWGGNVFAVDDLDGDKMYDYIPAAPIATFQVWDDHFFCNDWKIANYPLNRGAVITVGEKSSPLLTFEPKKQRAFPLDVMFVSIGKHSGQLSDQELVDVSASANDKNVEQGEGYLNGTWRTFSFDTMLLNGQTVTYEFHTAKQGTVDTRWCSWLLAACKAPFGKGGPGFILRADDFYENYNDYTEGNFIGSALDGRSVAGPGMRFKNGYAWNLTGSVISPDVKQRITFTFNGGSAYSFKHEVQNKMGDWDEVSIIEAE